MSTIVLIMNILLALAAIVLIYFSLTGQVRGKAWFKMGSFERNQYRYKNWNGRGKKKNQ